MTDYRNSFTIEDLHQINEADDLKIAPFKSDGVSTGTPTWIWNVVIDGELYVRAYYGVNSSWYKSALSQKAGKIYAAGMIKEVGFVPVSDELLNQKIDDAYSLKYAGNPYLASMISKQARVSTIRIIQK